MVSLAFLYLPAMSLRLFAALPICIARPSTPWTSPNADTGSIHKDVGKCRCGDGRGNGSYKAVNEVER